MAKVEIYYRKYYIDDKAQYLKTTTTKHFKTEQHFR